MTYSIFNIKIDNNISFKQGLDTGSIILINNDGTTEFHKSYGNFGISDSNGKITYYSSLYDAMDDANNGDVIKMFSNFTESNNTIILKDNISIDFGGYTYIYDKDDDSPAFLNLNPLEFFMYNGKIIRDSSHPDSTLLKNEGELSINYSGVFNSVENRGHCLVNNDIIQIIGDVQFFSDSTTEDLIVTNNDFTNFGGNITIFSLNSNTILSNGTVELMNATVFSSFNTILGDSVGIKNSFIVSSGQSCINCNEIQIENSSVYSFSGNGIICNNGEISSNIIKSLGDGIIFNSNQDDSGLDISNCNISTLNNIGIILNPDEQYKCLIKVVNNNITSIDSNTINIISTATQSSEYHKIELKGNVMSLFSSDNNEHVGVLVDNEIGCDVLILDNYIRVSSDNIDSTCINSPTGSYGIKYSNNKLSNKNNTPPIGANVIQLLNNTFDNFGNLIID